MISPPYQMRVRHTPVMTSRRHSDQPSKDPEAPAVDEILPRRTADRVARKRALVGRENRVEQLEALLFKHDPIGINYEHNTDEYRPEAETITLRRSEAISESALLRVIHEEFVRWFGSSSAGSSSRYGEIASEYWVMLQRVADA